MLLGGLGRKQHRAKLGIGRQTVVQVVKDLLRTVMRRGSDGEIPRDDGLQVSSMNGLTQTTLDYGAITASIRTPSSEVTERDLGFVATDLALASTSRA